MDLYQKRVMVTGANGFIGGRLCQVLYEKGAHVVGIARHPVKDTLYLTEHHVVDILDRQRVRQLVKKVQPEMVVHLAASKNRSLDLAEYRAGYEINLFGSFNLIEACMELTSLARFVFLGSCEEYGHQQVPFDESLRELPVSAYGVTKLAVTQLLQTLARAHGFTSVILRPTIVYGPGQGTDMFLPALINSLVSGERFSMSRGEQTRDFLYIDDLVYAILQALSVPGTQGRVINVSSGLPIRIDDLAKKAAQLIGPDSKNLIDFGARDYRAGEAMNYSAPNTQAQDLLDWIPRVALEDGLRQTIAYFRLAMSNS